MKSHHYTNVTSKPTQSTPKQSFACSQHSLHACSSTRFTYYTPHIQDIVRWRWARSVKTTDVEFGRQNVNPCRWWLKRPQLFHKCQTLHWAVYADNVTCFRHLALEKKNGLLMIRHVSHTQRHHILRCQTKAKSVQKSPSRSSRVQYLWHPANTGLMPV